MGLFPREIPGKLQEEYTRNLWRNSRRICGKILEDFFRNSWRTLGRNHEKLLVGFTENFLRNSLGTTKRIPVKKNHQKPFRNSRKTPKGTSLIIPGILMKDFCRSRVFQPHVDQFPTTEVLSRTFPTFSPEAVRLFFHPGIFLRFTGKLLEKFLGKMWKISSETLGVIYQELLGKFPEIF